MIRRITPFLLLLFVSVPSYALNTLKINLSKPENCLAWTQSGTENSVPIAFKGKTASLDLPLQKGKTPSAISLYILDRDTGNLAVRPVQDSSKPVQVISSDFNRVRRVRLHLVSDGKPVSSAVVTFTPLLDKPITRLVDSTLGGTLEFENVPEGTAHVKISYGDHHVTSMDVDIPLDRKTAIFNADVPLVGADTLSSDEVKSVQGTPTAKHKSTSSKHEGDGGSFARGLEGLLLVALVLWIFYVILRDKGILTLIRNRLSETEPESEESIKTEEPKRDETICPFCGQKKDPITGACACSLNAAPVGLPSGPPKLVGIGGAAIGQVYPLTAELTIGREPDNTIAMIQDSTVSRHHARIAVENGVMTLFDLQSSNGTYLNNARVAQEAIKAGDEIRIGGSLFRVEG